MFRLKNSWGSNFGNGGLCRVESDALPCFKFIDVFFRIEDLNLAEVKAFVLKVIGEQRMFARVDSDDFIHLDPQLVHVEPSLEESMKSRLVSKTKTTVFSKTELSEFDINYYQDYLKGWGNEFWISGMTRLQLALRKEQTKAGIHLDAEGIIHVLGSRFSFEIALVSNKRPSEASPDEGSKTKRQRVGSKTDSESESDSSSG